MKRKDVFSIADFAKFARTTRDTLLYYDKIDLLIPDTRTENNYRYYSSGQLAVVNLIHTCQELGMTLTEIHEIKDRRSAEVINQVLLEKIPLIDDKIESWVKARKLVLTLQKVISSAIGIDEDAITVEFRPAEAIILGDLNDYSQGKNDYDALFEFFSSCEEKYPNLNLNYPVWATFTEDRIKKRDWKNPDRYYFYNPEGLDKKPAALYAIGYTRAGYGQSDPLYKRLMHYIEEHNYEVCGPAFEEYPLNEVTTADEKNYLMRVMITVREKE
jgi:DNA-binding transcriptional MerR regulator